MYSVEIYFASFLHHANKISVNCLLLIHSKMLSQTLIDAYDSTFEVCNMCFFIKLSMHFENLKVYLICYKEIFHHNISKNRYFEFY